LVDTDLVRFAFDAAAAAVLRIFYDRSLAAVVGVVVAILVSDVTTSDPALPLTTRGFRVFHDCVAIDTRGLGRPSETRAASTAALGFVGDVDFTAVPELAITV
jgi:hypothetical protein